MGLRLLATVRVSLPWAVARSASLTLLDNPLPYGPAAPQEARALDGVPFFLARVMMSAALLLITLVMYTGQLMRPAMVMARNTASASSWGHGNTRVTGGRGRGGTTPQAPRAPPESKPFRFP